MTKVMKGIQTHETVANQRPAFRRRSPQLEVIFRHIVQQDFVVFFLGFWVAAYQTAQSINQSYSSTKMKGGLIERLR